MKSKEEIRKQTQMLVELRKQRKEQVKKAQMLLKEQQDIRKTLQLALKKEPCSVPGMSELTKIDAHLILWHIAAMKKYGIVEEAGMDDAGEYYIYRLIKEEKL